MGRTEHYNDPSAPKPNSLVPASNLLVVNNVGEILMMQRSDTGQWAIPGGKQEFGKVQQNARSAKAKRRLACSPRSLASWASLQPPPHRGIR